ncbi:MAG TPA: ABC transporter permease, partial [Clostridia bacterium]|nr:ABC transporter permease [Clostridia bacterium]
MLWNITVRNLKLFFRDKTAVFFSLLAVFIIIGLYVLFLGNMLTTGSDWLGDGARFIMDSWIMAGLLAVTSLTTTMGAYGIMIEDRTKKVLKDFTASPVRRSVLVGGYVTSAFIIGVIMSVITFILAEVYIVVYGGSFMDAAGMLRVFGCILLSVLASSAMVFFLVSFFKSNNAFATASTIIGTLVGFLTGIYIPIGSLPASVQAVVRVFPVSHAGALMRQIMMEAPLKAANLVSEAEEGFRLSLGVNYKFGDTILPAWGSVLILLATAALFYALAILNISR